MRSLWITRSLVILTILVCLGVGGYAGQVWWAKRMADHYPDGVVVKLSYATTSPPQVTEPMVVSCQWAVLGGLPAAKFGECVVASWRGCPWYGRWRGNDPAYGWIPRRYYWEALQRSTGQSLPNDPDAWETWFKAHPNLAWDEKQKRLVKPKP